MGETIILAPSANGAELIKSLAMHGKNSFNLRICGGAELARLGLMRSGVAITEDFISSREEVAIVAETMRDEKYFGKASYSDIQQVAAQIRNMRSLVDDEDEGIKLQEVLSKGIFKEKNEALLSVYVKYMNLISERRLIDSVSIIRKALKETEPLDADFCVLKEYPLSILEKALLYKLSGGNWKEKSISELFSVNEVGIKINSYKNCYGAPNEVETIFTDIYSGKQLDKCTVAVTDKLTYGQLFFDYALLYDIPVTFGCGIPVINSNPAKLLVLYYRWMTDGFFGASAIQSMLLSNAFDNDKLNGLYPETTKNFSWKTYFDVLSGIRLTNNKVENEEKLNSFKKSVAEEEKLIDPNNEKAYKIFIRKKLCIPFLEVLAKELSLPPEEFIYKYAKIRKGYDTNSQRLLMSLDIASASAIYEELRVIRLSGVEQATEDMILNVLKLSVANTRSEEGSLYVTGIDGAISSVRENLYIAGLSSSKYPGSPRENYLLLDADLKLFGPDATYITSEGRVKGKIDRLLSLVKLASGLGASINVSFAGLNVSDLKKDNASSLIFELYREEKGINATAAELEKAITNIKYFDPAISATRNVGKAYVNGNNILRTDTQDEKDKIDINLALDKEYSPSALNTFFNCPRNFMLSNVLGIPEPEEDKPFEVIAANEAGTLAHSMMEELANSDISLDDFLKLSEEAFDRFIMEKPPLVKRYADIAKNNFLEMMETAYNMEPQREVALVEEDIRCVHESGVKLHGYPDRVEKLDDGSYLVVDFKSSRSVSHTQDDIDSCLQAVIYAYLMEQKGYKVSGGEFRYMRLGKTVSCRYDDEIKAELSEKLKLFKKHIEEADFPIPDSAYDEDSDTCKFCKYGAVCGKAEEVGGEGDE